MHINCLFTTCIKYKAAHHIKSSLVSYAEMPTRNKLETGLSCTRDPRLLQSHSAIKKRVFDRIVTISAIVDLIRIGRRKLKY